MDITVKVEPVNEYLCRKKITDHNTPGGYFHEQQVQVRAPDIGSVVSRQLSIGHMLLADCRLDLVRDVQLSKEVNSEAVQLYFSLCNQNTVRIQGAPGSHAFLHHQHNIYYVPPSRSTQDYQAADRPLDFLSITIAKDTYFQLLPECSDLQRSFTQRILRREPAYCMPANLPITPAMEWIIREIRTCQRTGYLKRLFLEAKTIELLMLQLEQLHQHTGRPEAFPLREKEHRKVQSAKEILDADHQTPPTIVALAKMVGLNEFKLKRCFKAYTGTTVFGYITQLRMKQAHHWLLEGEKSVSEIAYLVGYTNASHFTAAFKRYYGELPKNTRGKAPVSPDRK